MLSMRGLPIVAYSAVLVLSLVRRRWRKAGLFIAGALLAAMLIGAITLLSDMRQKPLIEHYSWSGWHQAVYLGAYAVGAIVLLARPARGVARFVCAAGSSASRCDFVHRAESDEPIPETSVLIPLPSPSSNAIEAGWACWPVFRSSRGSGRSSTRQTSCSRRCSRPCATGRSFAAAPTPSWRPGSGRSWLTSCLTRCGASAARSGVMSAERYHWSKPSPSRRVAWAMRSRPPAPRLANKPTAMNSSCAWPMRWSGSPPITPRSFCLRNVEGLSHDEIAQRMGRGVGAVRMLWVRALARLRHELEPHPRASE